MFRGLKALLSNVIGRKEPDDDPASPLQPLPSQTHSVTLQHQRGKDSGSKHSKEKSSTPQDDEVQFDQDATSKEETIKYKQSSSSQVESEKNKTITSQESKNQSGSSSQQPSYQFSSSNTISQSHHSKSKKKSLHSETTFSSETSSSVVMGKSRGILKSKQTTYLSSQQQSQTITETSNSGESGEEEGSEDEDLKKPKKKRQRKKSKINSNSSYTQTSYSQSQTYSNYKKASTNENSSMAITAGTKTQKQQSAGLEKNDALDKKNKIRNKLMKKMGVFKRLDIDPDELLNYDAKMQDLMIKKYVASDVKPAEASHYIEQLNKVTAQIINIENEQDRVYYNPDYDPNDSQQSNGHFIFTNHASAWKNGRWDYGAGYYSMMSDVPKGIEYAEKARLNILKLEMEEQERRAAQEEFKKLEDERKKREALIDPETAAMNAEFVKYFMDGLKYAIDKDIEVYDEALKDLYTEDNKPNILIQKIGKGIAQKALRIAEDSTKIMNGIDYRKFKASKIAARNAEMMKEQEFRKIKEVQRGVAILKQMREKQEQIRIQEQHLLNQRLESGFTKKPQASRNSNNQVTSKTVVGETSAKSKAQNRYGEDEQKKKNEYSLIYENPSDEDRESFPLEEKRNVRQKMNLKSIAEDQKQDTNHLSSQTGIKSSLAKISLVKPELSRQEMARKFIEEQQKVKEREEQATNDNLPVVKQVPAVTFKQDINKWTRIKINQGTVMMINPQFDASDKQIFAKNNFRTNAENIDMFLEKNRSKDAGQEIFKPDLLGDLSKKVTGSVGLRSENPASIQIDFQLNYILDGTGAQQLERQKRRDRMMLNEKLRHEEQERERINHKVIEGLTLTEEEQMFLMNLQGNSKVEKIMEMKRQHIEQMDKKKPEVDILKRQKTKSNLSHSNTIKSNVISKSGANYNDSSYVTGGDGTTTNKQFNQSQMLGTQLDSTMKMLGDKEQLKLGGITGQQQQHLAELQINKNVIKNIMDRQVDDHTRRIVEHQKLNLIKEFKASHSENPSDFRASFAKTQIVPGGQGPLREKAVDIIRKGQEEHDELMQAINRKKQILQTMQNQAMHNPREFVVNQYRNVHGTNNNEDGEVRVGSVVPSAAKFNKKSRNLL